ncbi:MAG: hypothetical protein CMF23_13040 [Ignavibacteriae bacterium]|nr:hypothetical protein [Ignavibacteriota bacterium]
MKQVKKISLLILLLLTFCSEPKIKNPDVAKAYVDIMISREDFSYKLDTLALLRNEILGKYQLTNEEYETTIESLKSDEKAWEEFYKEVYKYLDSLKAEAGINN